MMTRMTLAFTALIALPQTASAYHNADFATAVSTGGGNGMYFTGSPRGKRIDCTACHVGGAGTVSIDITSDPPSLFGQGEWTPGERYQLTIRMVGEHLGDPDSISGFDNNSFVAELNNDSGVVVGEWDASGPDVFTMDIAGGDPRIVAGYAADGSTEWTVTLTAPEAGQGRLSLYLGAVDGNAAGGGVETPVDPFGDDVTMGAWRFCEAGTSCDRSFPELSEEAIDEAHESPARGCSATGTGGGVIGVLIVLAVLGWRRLALFALVGATGCLDSGDEPDLEECPNHVCEYTSEGNPFGDDPDLDVQFFRCQVQPVLQARCSNFACHGDVDRAYLIYAPNRLRIAGNGEGETVLPTTEAEFAANRAEGQEFVFGDDPARSMLLLKPLDTSAGGYYHFGKSLYYQSDVFETTDDRGYQNIEQWIRGQTASPDCLPTTEVGP